MSSEDEFLFQISIGKKNEKAILTLTSARKVSSERLPIENDYLPIEQNFSKDTNFSEQEIYIYRNNKEEFIGFPAITSVIDSWRELYESILHNLGITEGIRPIFASTGSFSMRIKSSDPKTSELALKILN